MSNMTTEAKTFHDHLTARGFAFDYNDGAPKVVAPKGSADRLSAEEKATLTRLRAGILALIEPPMLRPYLTKDGELRIGHKTHERFHWYKPKGQSVWQTLIELNAPLATWALYAYHDADLLTAAHAARCPGAVTHANDFAACAECGRYAEIQNA